MPGSPKRSGGGGHLSPNANGRGGRAHRAQPSIKSPQPKPLDVDIDSHSEEDYFEDIKYGRQMRIIEEGSGGRSVEKPVIEKEAPRKVIMLKKPKKKVSFTGAVPGAEGSGIDIEFYDEDYEDRIGCCGGDRPKWWAIGCASAFGCVAVTTYVTFLLATAWAYQWGKGYCWNTSLLLGMGSLTPADGSFDLNLGVIPDEVKADDCSRLWPSASDDLASAYSAAMVNPDMLYFRSAEADAALARPSDPILGKFHLTCKTCGYSDFAQYNETAFFVAQTADRDVRDPIKTTKNLKSGRLLLVNTVMADPHGAGAGGITLRELQVFNFPQKDLFLPDGMYYHEGEQLLFVINHAYDRGGERIDVFSVDDVRGDFGVPYLRANWLYAWKNSDFFKFGSLSNLVALEKDVVVVTRDLSPEDKSDGTQAGNLDESTIAGSGSGSDSERVHRAKLFGDSVYGDKSSDVLLCKRLIHDSFEVKCTSVDDGFVKASGISFGNNDKSVLHVVDSANHELRTYPVESKKKYGEGHSLSIYRNKELEYSIDRSKSKHVPLSDMVGGSLAYNRYEKRVFYAPWFSLGSPYHCGAPQNGLNHFSELKTSDVEDDSSCSQPGAAGKQDTSTGNEDKEDDGSAGGSEQNVFIGSWYWLQNTWRGTTNLLGLGCNNNLVEKMGLRERALAFDVSKAYGAEAVTAAKSREGGLGKGFASAAAYATNGFVLFGAATQGGLVVCRTPADGY